MSEREKVREQAEKIIGFPPNHEEETVRLAENTLFLLREVGELEKVLRTTEELLRATEKDCHSLKTNETALRDDLARVRRRVEEVEEERDTLKGKVEECEQFGPVGNAELDACRIRELTADRDRLREGVRELGKAWACSDPEGPSTKEEMTANECAADLWALLEVPQPAHEERKPDA